VEQRPRQDQRLIVQYKIGAGSVVDFDKRVRVEDLMIECLGRTGLGVCDGGDMGSGSMNVFCFVTDLKEALPVVVEALKANGLLNGAVIAGSIDDSEEILWPEGFEGRLEPL
jgi:hypothetical protein